MAYGTVNADVIQTSTSGGILGAGDASIMKNRIINGDFRVSQYNGTSAATITGSGSIYAIDRFSSINSITSGTMSVQQSTTAPVGFATSFAFTNNAAVTASAGQLCRTFQGIEGVNFADLNWGSANAKTVTVSFWVRSSLTGTYAGSITNGAGNRSYVFTYTISAANTWQQVLVTIAGDTGGTWIGATNACAAYLIFDLGSGSSSQSTAGSWQTSSTYYSATSSSINWAGTNGATFYITGVQLEVGSSATGFEYVNYQTSLANCQRYCQIVLGVANQQSPWVFSASATTDVTGNYQYVVSMRTSPSLTVIGSSFQLIDAANNTFTSGTIGLDNTNYNSTRIYSTSTSGLTQFRTYWMRSTNANSYYLFTSEL